MSACLVASSGHSAPLGPRVVRVGSDAQADLPILGDLGLAPWHYEIMPNEHGYWIRGMTPGFPLLINGQPVEVALLKEGDVITAGVLDLTFRQGPSQAPPPAPPPPPSMVVMPAPVMHQSFAQVAMPPEMPLEPVSHQRLPTPSQDQNDEPYGYTPAPAPASTEQTSGGYRRPPRPEEEDDGRYGHMSEAERRQARLMEQTEERTRRHLEELKAEQNYSGAFMAALVTLAVATFAYGAITGLRMKFFLIAVGVLGYAIGWVVKVVGKGQETRFGKLGAGTALAAILIVNFLAVGGLFEMREDTSEPADSTEVVESEYSSDAEEEEDDDDDYDPLAGLSDEQAMEVEEEMRLARNEALKATDKAGKLARFEPEEDEEDFEEEEEGDSVTTVIQTVGFMWIMFGPKSLVAYFIMTIAAYRASFRSLSSEEASALHGHRA